MSIGIGIKVQDCAIGFARHIVLIRIDRKTRFLQVRTNQLMF